jgi:localization factor PodJL
MKPGIPWSVKGIEPEVREAAKHAARRAGMTLGEWLNTVILDQSDDPASGNPPSAAPLNEDFFSREPEQRFPRKEETTIRLEDIAQQLSQLAQRERESATILPYESPRGRDQDRDALNRILNRIDSNERQAVEAFTAVNERLSVLGRQIVLSAKTPAPVFEKPEDVPGYGALEAAIRNVVEHIEVSEKRTRDSLKSMQDRLGDMAERATHHGNADDLVRAAPAFTGLETRIADMAARMQRSETLLQAGLPDLVRKELNQLADRIESVRQSSETLAIQAQSSAVGVAKNELRDIESRILGVLKEAQATIGSQTATAADLQRLRSEIGGLNKRIDDVKSATATDHDVHALRIAVEQLSTRVAQGPDMRPLADMDRRIGDLTRKLDQNHAAARNLPQFGELERRIAELDHRFGEAMRLQGDQKAVQALEKQIAAVNDRVGRTEQQLGHLETMERAIHQLYESLEQSRTQASQMAEDAANRAVDRLLSAQQISGPSPELRAMEEGLRAVRESAAGAEQRNQETLEAVHETLEQIVNKLAELETTAAGHQLAVNMAQQAAVQQPAWQQESAEPAAQSHQTQFFDPTGAFGEQSFAPQTQEYAAQTEAADAHAPAQECQEVPAPAHEPEQPALAPQDFQSGSAADLTGGDDFIAAARRAAHAAASRPNVLHPDVKPQLKAGANSKFSFSLPFIKAKQPKPVTYTGGKPVVEIPAVSANDNKRKKLVLAGIVLLAAVSAFAFNMLAKPPKQPKQSTAIEAPLSGAPSIKKIKPAEKGKTVAPAPAISDGKAQSSLIDVPDADLLATGSLPVRKTDATISSIVAEPGRAAKADLPPPDVGTAALREAAARGDAKAQFIVASRYLDGQSVAQDLPKAAQWYQYAASQGLAPAQYRLATMFERGKGVPQDIATAFLWYERAAEGGNVKSMHNAAVIAAGNQAGTPNYDKAFKWFKSAAMHGLHDSQFNLAVLYERGLGTKIDKVEAHFWYTLAGNQGDADAVKRAETIAKTLGGEVISKAAARVAAWKPSASADEANIVAVTDAVWNGVDPVASSAPSQTEPATAANPIAEAQFLLGKMGFNVGTADGKMGNRTSNAIRLFQLQSGMKVTGEVTPELLEKMRSRRS